MPPSPYPWEQPLGAHPAGPGRVTFRTWAPAAEHVAVRLADSDHPLADEGFGVRAATLQAAHGDRYELVLDGTAWPDPASRWQPDGLRGPSAVLDPGAFAWTDAGWTGAALARRGHLRAARRHVLGGGHLRRARSRTCAALRRRSASRRSSSCRWPSSPAAAAGATTASTSRAAQSSYGGPRRAAAPRRRRPRRGPRRRCSTSSTTTSAPPAGSALEAFGPYFTDKHATLWGAAINYDDADSDPCASGCCRAPRAGSATSTSTACASTRSTRSYDSSPAHLVVARSRAASTRPDARALVIAESGLNDPQVMRPPERGGWGCDAAWADDFHHALRVAADRRARRLLRGVRRASRDLAKALRRPHVHDGDYSTFRAAPLRRARPTTCRPSASSSSPPTTTRSATARSATACRAEVRPLAAFCDAAVTVHADAVHGRGVRRARRRSSSSPTTSTRTSPTATREGRRREFAAFAAFAGEEVPDPQDRGDLRALQAHPRRRAAGLARALPRALLARPPRAAAPATPTRSPSTRTPRWLRVRRGAVRPPRQLRRREPCTCRSSSRRAPCWHARHATARGRGVVVPAALARSACCG